MIMYDIQADPTTSFSMDISCGDIIFDAQFYLEDVGEIATNGVNSEVFFYQNGTYTIYTNDVSTVGLHELIISAHVL